MAVHVVGRGKSKYKGLREVSLDHDTRYNGLDSVAKYFRQRRRQPAAATWNGLRFVLLMMQPAGTKPGPGYACRNQPYAIPSIGPFSSATPYLFLLLLSSE